MKKKIIFCVLLIALSGYIMYPDNNWSEIEGQWQEISQIIAENEPDQASRLDSFNTLIRHKHVHGLKSTVATIHDLVMEYATDEEIIVVESFHRNIMSLNGDLDRIKIEVMRIF